MNNLLSSFMEKLVCSQDECLSWIIILLNILTVFYLVFCSWFRVTKAVKAIGYAWASALTVGTVAVVAVHTCIFTILSAVFTALIVMAVLSVVFDKGIFERTGGEEKQVKPSGSYVVHKTDKGNFAFVLYDNRKNAIAKSCFKYNDIDETKAAIEVCRQNGYIASVEDRTKSWIEFVNHPKFELFKKNGKYLFVMSLTSDKFILKSANFNEYEQCEKTMKTAISAVRSEKVYYAEREILADGQFTSEGCSEQQYISDTEIAVTADTYDDKSSTDSTEITLKEGLDLAANSTRKEKITKKYIADYLNSKFRKGVETNCRANYIKSGRLPLADTHYVKEGKNKVCFAFVYEVNNTVMLLLKISKELGRKFAKSHTNVRTSAFPRSKEKWYSVIVDDSFTNDDVESLLSESYIDAQQKIKKV